MAPPCYGNDNSNSSASASASASAYSTNNSYKMMFSEEKQGKMKQGIVSILSSHHINNSLSSSTFPPPNPIRRTLSADMSSQKWLTHNGFSSSIKRAQSSEQLNALGEEGDYESDDQSSNGEEKGAAFEDVWSSIQASKKQSWSSILSQQTKTDGSGSGSGSGEPPYVHPTVKRTTSSLSEKSLEICTESLGSETGSDVFSYPSSDPEDSDKDNDQQVEVHEEAFNTTTNNNNNNNSNVVPVEEVKEYVEVMDDKYTTSTYKKVTPRAFPPPLPSLAHRDGSNLHMRSHRQGGRLVLEAVTVPSQNRFRAERHDGRLLLTLAAADNDVADPGDTNDPEEEGEGEEEEVVEEVEEKEKELAIVMDHPYKASPTQEELTSRMINVHRSSPSALIMSKLMELTSTRNKSTWPRTFNATVIKTLDEEEDEDDDQLIEEEHSKLPRLMPAAAGATMSTAATAAAASALNAYEYYWRRRTNSSPTTAAAAVAVLKPLGGHQQQKKNLGGGGGVVPQVEKSNSNMNRLLLGHNGKSESLTQQQQQLQQQQQQQQEVVLVKAAAAGKGGLVATTTTTATATTTTTTEKQAEYLVPMLRGCKEPRRSLLIWEPYCIATS